MDSRQQVVDNPNDKIASQWLSRAKKADKYFDDWHTAFKCDVMQQYFYGFQF